MAKITRTQFGPEAVNLPALPSGGSRTRVTFDLEGMSESGVHGFIRVVPLLGEAMAKSKLPIDQVDHVGKAVGVLCDVMADGKITPAEILTAIEALK